ncbi:restriction endonuclease subunit S [Thiothrix sp.]|jgi:type I restriction enzyme S subunit|uniref:restriction endonuclease subunit S n=1 Tax=Thiothrix sp. TaxID=1032 RepID=UPI00257E11F8|nr:restriction endonuclease subunit S [Thiothrix sp.]
MAITYQPYPEYKDSGIDSTPCMPTHWVTGKVKYISDNLDKQRIPLSAEERGNKKGNYPYYGASGIIDHVDDYIFDEETILFGEDGANLLARSSALAFIANGKYWVNNHAHILRTKDGLNNFWVMCLENLDITSFVTGSAQPKLTAEALGALQLVYPALHEERQKIAEFLDHETAKIDTLIDKQQQLIKLLKEKRQAVISHAVTKGLNPDVPMKDSGVEWLGEVPEHWVIA